MGHLVDIQRPIPFSCEACKHFISGCRCKAFDVIPIELFGEAESHNKVLKSQNGDFVFETDAPREYTREYVVEDESAS